MDPEIGEEKQKHPDIITGQVYSHEFIHTVGGLLSP